MNLSLKNRSALVGGGSRGMGRAIARELAQVGANVTLMARSETLLSEAVKELDTSQHQKHHFIVADFEHPEELEKKVVAHLKTHGPIQILVNNTGGPPPGTVMEAELVDFERAFKMHLYCNHLLTKAVAPGMKEGGYGRIINIISTSVKQPIPGLGVSNTVRAAVAQWAKTLSAELGPYGITVNNILPGATKTDRLFSLVEKKAKRIGISADEVLTEMMTEIPAGRFAEPNEIGGVVTFLASPAAAYISGINLPVDGGRTVTL